jgi:hypothetical protein
MLRIAADDRVCVDKIIASYGSESADHGVRTDSRPGTDANLVFDDGVWPDLYARFDMRFARNDCGRVN